MQPARAAIEGSIWIGGIIITSQRRGPREHIYLVLVIIVAVAFLTDKVWAAVGRFLFPHRSGKR